MHGQLTRFTSLATANVLNTVDVMLLPNLSNWHRHRQKALILFCINNTLYKYLSEIIDYYPFNNPRKFALTTNTFYWRPYYIFLFDNNYCVLTLLQCLALIHSIHSIPEFPDLMAGGPHVSLVCTHDL